MQTGWTIRYEATNRGDNMKRQKIPGTAPDRHTAERIFFNGVIYTVDAAFSKGSVLACRNGEILYVGNDRKAAERVVSPHAERVNLEGKTVVPGLVEGHMHFLSEGQYLSEMDIFYKPKAEILHLVAQEAQSLGPGKWIIGRGWNHESWLENTWPTKEDLDAVAPDNPVALTRVDHHSLWGNSLALQAAGINRNTPDPQGGEILRGADGDPQGILIDTPMFMVREAIPPLSEAETLEAYRKAQQELFRYGITSIADAGQSVENFQTLSRAYRDGLLKIRVHGMLAGYSGQDVLYLEAGGKPVSGLYDERLSLRAFKAVCDGSLGSRSAWLLAAYADRPGHRGNSRYTDEELSAFVKRARLNGFQACLHGIGNAAVRQALNAIERVLAEYPLPDHRYRIEHFQIVEPEDRQRARRLGIIPTMQTIHATSDRQMAERRLSSETIAEAYAWRRWLDQGGIFANGSDAPMEVLNPFLGFHAAVTRQDCSGAPPGGWYPDQKLSRKEALQSYTIWAAYAEFTEHRKGSLERGKLADFTVLDKDIMTCPAAELKDTRALMTILGGEIVYRAAQW